MAKQVNCSDAGMECDFMVRSEDESEVIELVKRHAEHAHDQTMSTADVRGVMKDA